MAATNLARSPRRRIIAASLVFLVILILLGWVAHSAGHPPGPPQEMAVPMVVRQHLPPAIRTLLEDRINDVGLLRVMHADPPARRTLAGRFDGLPRGRTPKRQDLPRPSSAGGALSDIVTVGSESFLRVTSRLQRAGTLQPGGLDNS